MGRSERSAQSAGIRMKTGSRCWRAMACTSSERRRHYLYELSERARDPLRSQNR
jgi:hypothetical protein